MPHVIPWGPTIPNLGCRQPQPGIGDGLVGYVPFNLGFGNAVTVGTLYEQLNYSTKFLQVRGAALWAPSVAGWGLKTASGTANTGAVLDPIPRTWAIFDDVTIVWYGVLLGDAISGANFPRLAEVEHNDGALSPFNSYGITRSGAGNTDITWVWNSANVNQNITSAGITGPAVYNRPITLGFVHRLNRGVAGYMDGKQVMNSPGAATAGINYNSFASQPPQLDVGMNPGAGTAGCSNAVNLAVAIWHRALSSDEMRRINLDPFCFIASPLRQGNQANVRILRMNVPFEALTKVGQARDQFPAGPGMPMPVESLKQVVLWGDKGVDHPVTQLPPWDQIFDKGEYRPGQPDEWLEGAALFPEKSVASNPAKPVPGRLPIESAGSPADALSVAFGVNETVYGPLVVQFSVEKQDDLTPLPVSFNVVEGGNGLVVSFDVVPQGLTAARSKDVQMPAADVQLSSS